MRWVYDELFPRIEALRVVFGQQSLAFWSVVPTSQLLPFSITVRSLHEATPTGHLPTH